MIIPAKELLDYRRIFEDELHNNILAYWLNHSIDTSHDGFYGAVDLKGAPVPTAKKSCVLNARILWTFSAAASAYDNPSYARMADRAYHVLQKYFADPEHGGYFMELNPDNSVAVDIKHTYAQAFVVYSQCKYYEFRSSPAVLKDIQDCFSLLESKAKETTGSGYCEAFTRDWRVYEENRMADNNEPKSMNTHLHLLEAYAALYRDEPLH
jgi:mannobiose 2-epimerase